MSDLHTLSYQSPGAPSRARLAAFLLLLTIGCIYLVAGFVATPAIILSAVHDARIGAGPSPTDPAFLAIASLGSLIPLSIGAALAWGAFRIKRGSLTWTRAIRLLAILNLIIFLVEGGGALYGVFTERSPSSERLLVYGLITAFFLFAAAMITIIALLDKTIKELRPPAAAPPK